MTMIETFTEFAAGLEFRRLPPEVVSKAKLRVIDTVSACLTVGSTDGSGAALALLGQCRGGTSRVIGRRERTDAERGGFINAVSAAATIRTDTHSASASHPGMVVVPAVLACGEASGISGRAALTGIIAGYEFMIRLGLAVITPELASIFRPTGLLGPGAAALGVAAATKLGQAETVRAVALACHSAAGFNEWIHAGTNEHIYHAGFAARNAITSVHLAMAGAEAAPSVLEGRSGLLAGFSALGRAEQITEDLGRHFCILDTVHKPAPACIFAQSPAQAALALLQEHTLDPAEIDSIDIFTSPRAVSFPGCDNSGPFVDAPSVQQSIQFSVAAVMAAGAVRERLWHLPVDPLVHRIAASCRLAVDASAEANRQPVRLLVRLRDGRTVASSLPDFTSMTETEVVARFLQSALPVLGAAQADRALHEIMQLDEAADLNTVTALFAPA